MHHKNILALQKNEIDDEILISTLKSITKGEKFVSRPLKLTLKLVFTV